MKNKEPEHEHDYQVRYVKEKVDHRFLSDKQVDFKRQPMQFKMLVCKCGRKLATDLIPIGGENA